MAEKRGRNKQKIKPRNPRVSVSKPGVFKNKKSGSSSKKHKIMPHPDDLLLIEEHIKKAPHELEEEFFVPSPIHRGRYQIPLGIKFLIGYLFFLLFVYLVSFISGIDFPTTILFGKMISGTRALVVNAVLVLIIAFMIFGFWKRKSYTFDLSICFFGFTALNALLSMVLLEPNEHPLFKKLLILSFASLLLMNSVVIRYILHERKFFFSEFFHDRPVHQRDKFFLFTVIAFWTAALLIGVTFGMQFYKDTTRIIDSTISELNSDANALAVCDGKSGHERDICNLVLATFMSEKNAAQDEMNALCSSIQSEFYRFTCMRSISG